MYYIHWLSWFTHKWCYMPVDDSSLLSLELSFTCDPGCYIDEQIERDEPE